MFKKLSFLILFIFANLSFGQEINLEPNYQVLHFPILEKINTLSPRTKKWMKKWNNLNLEDDTFLLNEISGTTSVNVKIHQLDTTDVNGKKSFGSFVTLNESANPNSEIAYFNLAALLGVDHLYRPTIKYVLGPKASDKFLITLNNTQLKGELRNKNKNRIINTIAANKTLNGCLKAKKSETADELEEIIKTGWFHSNGTLKSTHPISKFIQANKPQPKAGDRITLKNGYVGDAAELSREFSIMLTLDSIFGQYDRFSGGNVVIEKDENNNAHFFGSDNGGAEVVDSTTAVKQNIKLFSRYDKKIVEELKKIQSFLNGNTSEYLGYTNPENFILDLGLYYRKTPKEYLSALRNNFNLVLNAVHENEEKYGESVYFQ